MTYPEYLEAKQRLEELNKAIEEAPPERVPVFKGIVELHKSVKQYERRHLR